MYKAFDSFLSTETWHTRHALDDERFHNALHQVISNPTFNPDSMRDYMRAKKGIGADDHESGFAKAIDRRAQDAWAVKDYLAYTRGTN
jgi:hypothetical protein